MKNSATITAISTSPGKGAIAVIRMSGPLTFTIIKKVYRPVIESNNKYYLNLKTTHLGSICDKEEWIDEVLITLYKAPNSYTGDDMAEISCHGSTYIQHRILQVLIKYGARPAETGEFTLMAFIHGKMDLSQAEAVADLIDARSQTAHTLAKQQMRGGYSEKIKALRKKMVSFASLIELELDFSEEDVTFADRDQLKKLLADLKNEIKALHASFSLGNVLKHGIPIAIVGSPNAGKSTLLNALLNEERALVSDIPGTTRDTIEDTIVINGTAYRFIDTAGLRESEEKIEIMGMKRTWEKIDKAAVVLYVIDGNAHTEKQATTMVNGLLKNLDARFTKKQIDTKKIIVVVNKCDLKSGIPYQRAFKGVDHTVYISAKEQQHLEKIIEILSQTAAIQRLEEELVVTNTRHFYALERSLEAIREIEKGLSSSIPTDLVAVDIRTAMHYLGEITGEISSQEVLESIFSTFCIGK
ncbi:MAG: tRNA uridine-5-carboxymethylaminomethyl(34) synthesis GTPase MnmE [Bacteroidales bacterium]|nr:tRNA uridine-5-carboxymethylaminomethyl(34) synthesis GTPase MnmE [Bacteroidales bacterium]